MKRSLTLGGIVVLALFLLSCQADLTKSTDDTPVPVPASAAADVQQPTPDTASTLSLTSGAFEQDTVIPTVYACDGSSVNPPLSIKGVPNFTKSLVLIMEDPDASPLYVHWVLWNMVPQDQDIPEDLHADASQLGITTEGKSEYIPPCPLNGSHTYHFRLFALDTRLQFDSAPSAGQLEDAMQEHILGQTELRGTYQRTQ